MATYSRLEVLNTIIETGLVPVFYHKDLQVVKRVVEACLEGGTRLFEFTNRGDFAPQVFSELSQYLREAHPEAILGVGSVLDAPTAALYIASGANFVVGPVLNPEVARLCNRRKIAYSPGCGSASEISQAEELGAEIVKIFPGESVGGPNFVKAVLGPCPWTRIMPTGGVEMTRESIGAWFKAGVAAVGIGSQLMRKDLLAAGNYPAITQAVAQALAYIAEARGRSPFLGLEHVGLYDADLAQAQQVAEWYRDVFGFGLVEGPGSYFLEGRGSGRIEVSKERFAAPAHIAVRVSSMDAALQALQAKGIQADEPSGGALGKVAYLNTCDPAGRLVHLVWRPG